MTIQQTRPTATGVGLPAGTTHLPRVDDDAPPAVPRTSIGRPSADEQLVQWGPWLSAGALAWLLTQQLLPLPGLPWFVVAWFALGLLVTAVLAGMQGGSIAVKDRLAASIITGGAVTVGVALVSTVGFVFWEGWEPLLHLNFFTDDMAGVGPRDPFTRGGIAHAVLGSLIQLGIGLAITLPLGIGTAVFMTEVGGRFARLVRTIVEAMTALPSIVAGLFVYTVFILTLGQPRSGLAAGLAIAVMMLPIIARAADVVLRVVPGGLREASLALGASRWKTVWHVVLPTARPGLATAVILGSARGVGETSPVLLTSGAAAGLAGALEVAGPIGQLTPYVPAGYGFAAIIVAFVGRLHPVGMIFSAILMSMFYIGGELAQSRLGLPKSLTGVFQGLLLFTLLACDTLITYRVRWTGLKPAGGAR